jgi:F-type H+-transporting ATPase subunit b
LLARLADIGKTYGFVRRGILDFSKEEIKMEHFISWSSIPLGRTEFDLGALPPLGFAEAKLGFALANLREGFGFNGNILETNILNLGVVLGIVVSLGGDTLRSLLNSRQEGISKNLKQAEERAQEAKQRVSEAKSQLEKAQNKAVEINEQGKTTADKEKKDSVNRKKEELSRLTEKKEQILYVEEQKAVSQVYNQLVKRVMDEAKNKLLRLDSQSHDSVIKYQLGMLSKYQQ